MEAKSVSSSQNSGKQDNKKLRGSKRESALDIELNVLEKERSSSNLAANAGPSLSKSPSSSRLPQNSEPLPSTFVLPPSVVQLPAASWKRTMSQKFEGFFLAENTSDF